MALWSVLLRILQKPTIGGVLSELMVFVAPLWIAVIAGVLVGWAWKPKWANLGREMLESSISDNFAKTAASPTLASLPIPSWNSLKFQLPSCISGINDDGVEKSSSSLMPSGDTDCRSSKLEKENLSLLMQDDLEHLCKLVEYKDGGPAWIHMMDKSIDNMSYQAWRRDPENGPPEYCTRTVYEDATPELLRDFFWDDKFRLKWDDMLKYVETVEECPTTGTMVVHWIRKFPLCIGDREYVIGRRIWESGRSYYCVTKGVPCTSVPRRTEPRRVDLFYSSWCIRAVESKRGDGQLTACEVLLFHHEDMGVPWKLAKFGVSHGMWGAVRKILPGLRAYQKQRASGAPLSRYAFMSQINTKVSADYLRFLESSNNESAEVETLNSPEKPQGGNIPKLLVVGGAIVLACTLDKGLLTKAIIFGVARRFVKFGRRL